MRQHESYERRRWLLDRDDAGVPSRACECRFCPIPLERPLTHAGPTILAIATMLEEGRSLPYWSGRTCAHERHPQFADELEKCESPIEVSLLCSLYDLFAYEIAAGRAAVEAQAGLPGGYRADILIVSATGDCFDIECDGAEFHKDRGRDERRDAVLAAEGITVLRFPGDGMGVHRRVRATEVFLAVRRRSKAPAGAA